MPIQNSITLPSQIVVPDAYAVIGGFTMIAGGAGIRTSVAWYATKDAFTSGAPTVQSTDYELPNPVPMALITPIVVNGSVNVLSVMYAALQASGFPDFVGSTLV